MVLHGYCFQQSIMTDQDFSRADIIPLKTVLWRGFLMQCPRCGCGDLLYRYLKQHDKCSCCGESIGRYRADDAPPWLTIFAVGHILAPLMLAMMEYDWLSQNNAIAVCSLLACLLTGVILPRAKGLFIALLWRTQQQSQDEARE